MRVLAACSLGGAGHLNPMLPLLAAAIDRGDEVLVVGLLALATLVDEAGLAFHAGGEPPESAVAPIRELLVHASREDASRLGNRELFGHLATTAMRPGVTEAVMEWRPDLIMREPCEYASAIVAAERGIPVAQIAISTADGELRLDRVGGTSARGAPTRARRRAPPAPPTSRTSRPRRTRPASTRRSAIAALRRAHRRPSRTSGRGTPARSSTPPSAQSSAT